MSLSSVGRWRHKNGISAVEIFENVNNRPQTSCQILRTVTIDIVIKSTHAALHFAYATVARSPISYGISRISGPVSCFLEGCCGEKSPVFE